jgi:hypothetical protein
MYGVEQQELLNTLMCALGRTSPATLVHYYGVLMVFTIMYKLKE